MNRKDIEALMASLANPDAATMTARRLRDNQLYGWDFGPFPRELRQYQAEGLEPPTA